MFLKSGTVEFEQIYTGFNAPSAKYEEAERRNPKAQIIMSSAETFTSMEEVKTSWIASAVAAEDLANILTKVDFQQQILISVTAGMRPNLTGTITVKKVTAKKGSPSSFMPYIYYGVNESDCAQPFGRAFPFVLLTIDRPKSNTEDITLNHFNQNYPDGCKPVATVSTKGIIFD